MKYHAFSAYLSSLALGAALVAAPLAVSAVGPVPAGFPPQSIWLSTTDITAGDSVTLYTVLYNSSDAILRGTLEFAVDGTAIASKQFELLAGQTNIESAEWRAVAGLHSFSASIKNASGADAAQTIAISNTASSIIRVSVAEPPPPTALQQTVTDVTNIVSTVASSTLPVAGSVAQSIFGMTESFRNAGIAYAESALSEKSASIVKHGVSSTTTVRGFEAPQEKGDTDDIFSKLGQLAAPGILFTFSSPALFYFLFCLLLLGGFYLLSRMVNRPRF